tara:strand:- start:163 stop:390 length:228 start_codon:yes stop_codon:yes gene_type:complete
MDELIDMIAMDKSPSEVTDKIKDVLYGKAAERIDALKPDIASQMFDATTDDEVSDEPVDSMDDSYEEEEEEEEES